MSLDLSTTLLIVSIVINSGAIGWIIKREVSHATLVNEVDTLKADVANVRGRTETLEKEAAKNDSLITEIRSKLDKLDKIPELLTSVDFIRERIDSFVTRVEFEARLSAVEKH